MGEVVELAVRRAECDDTRPEDEQMRLSLVAMDLVSELSASDLRMVIELARSLRERRASGD